MTVDNFFKDMTEARYPHTIITQKSVKADQVYLVRRRAYLIGINDMAAIANDFAAWVALEDWTRGGDGKWEKAGYTVHTYPELFQKFLNEYEAPKNEHQDIHKVNESGVLPDDERVSSE